MQYGKGITTGLILEPAHRQGESERTEEGEGNIRAETNGITKSHIKRRACPPTPRCLCACVLSHSHTSLIAGGVVEKLEMAHTCMHT